MTLNPLAVMHAYDRKHSVCCLRERLINFPRSLYETLPRACSYHGPYMFTATVPQMKKALVSWEVFFIRVKRTAAYVSMKSNKLQFVKKMVQ